ncbi:hypothetical protein [Microbacterium sp. VKM Ac-2923]|uniref:hypothetical protein n=1 Tax=Microbacterium sp. VKM Ac-2923 TaxID=2929476 RepID=UPI001FB334AD|nr:hypothetical protein [Microbacterium sp. VKM Ac-2923]MCJ1708374.1 hypothetical protein [Microbacterium sp. VKM Ac-2923]
MHTSAAEVGDSRPKELALALARHERDDPGFWDFATNRRQGGHAFFQYPAMMVPELQGTLLDDLLAVAPDTTCIYDPFLGSGTVLLESAYRGLAFFGTDINPMATLLSRVKADPPSEEEAAAAVTRVVTRASAAGDEELHEFTNRDKWFNSDVALELTRLRASICKENEARLRRFLWVCLAETIRMVSNSRTSTFKLHVYAAKDLAARKPHAIETFTSIGASNAARAGEHWRRIHSLPEDRKAGAISIVRGSVLDDVNVPVRVDAIMTSPPYGDNDTTVPYGQHSYLPLQWIDHADLGADFDADLIRSTGRLDTVSLGGSLVNALNPADRARLETASPALRDFNATLEATPALLKKVLSFSRDYELALRRSTRPLREGGFSFWTLGQRRVGGLELPLVRITAEFLMALGHSEVTTIIRQLPRGRKRMAMRNNIGATMATEHVLVMAKGNQ